MTLKAGTRIGGYEVIEPLGAGGMGEVRRAFRASRLRRWLSFMNRTAVRSPRRGHVVPPDLAFALRKSREGPRSGRASRSEQAVRMHGFQTVVLESHASPRHRSRTH